MHALYKALEAILAGYGIEEIALTMPDGDPSQVIVADDGELWAEQGEGERLVVILQLVKLEPE
jgi:hypothetical protein